MEYYSATKRIQLLIAAAWRDLKDRVSGEMPISKVTYSMISFI